MAAHPLDNAVWHSLTAADRTLVEQTKHAARYLPEVSPFGGIPDEPSPDAWRGLAELVGPDGATVLFRRRVEVPPAWTVVHRIHGVQMVAPRVDGVGEVDGVDGVGIDSEAGIEVLGTADVPEMLELVRATQPGPFGKRTVELGDYLGIRESGRLVAMAGERLRPEGYTEISAVCTDDRHRGRGLATRLVRILVQRIQARGEQAFLHAAADNEPAIRLYTSLGFEVRCLADAVIVRPTPG